MSQVTVFCFLASYIVALALEVRRMFHRSALTRGGVLFAGLAGLVAHTIYLVVRSQQSNLPPLLSSSHDWLLVLAWMVIFFYLLLSVGDADLPLGVFLLPLVLVLIGSAYFVSTMPNELITAQKSAQEIARKSATQHWVMLHAGLLVFGMAGVIMGFILSMMYLVQHRRLKHKQTMQQGFSLPSLAKLARWNWWSVMISVPLLTLGMATGVVLGLVSQKETPDFTFSDPVVITNGVVWLLMVGFFFWMARTTRPAARQVAWTTIWAFGFLLFTLLGLQILTGAELFDINTWHTDTRSPTMKFFVSGREMPELFSSLHAATDSAPQFVSTFTLDS